MHRYKATITWRRTPVPDQADAYSRAHQWRFDGGAVVDASASPSIVKPPLSDPTAVDPEEAFVASLSSCHMLWLLHLAEEAGLHVAAYLDEAEGTMTTDSHGGLWISRVVLRPEVTLAAACTDDTRARLGTLHRAAHKRCFIANSVKTEVVVEPRDVRSR